MNISFLFSFASFRWLFQQELRYVTEEWNFYCSRRKKNAEIKIKINGMKFIVTPSTQSLMNRGKNYDVISTASEMFQRLMRNYMFALLQNCWIHCVGVRLAAGLRDKKKILELLPFKNRFERIPFKPLSLFDQFHQHILQLATIAIFSETTSQLCSSILIWLWDDKQ